MNERDTVEVIRAEVAPVVKQAAFMTVTSPSEYQGAAEFLKSIKGAQKRVIDHFAGMKEAAHKAWKAVTTQEADTLKPLAEAEATIKRNMLAYQTEQERIRQAEQRRLQAAADEAARKEREKAEAAARLQREKEQAALQAAEEARKRSQAASNEAERAKAAAAVEKAMAAASKAAAAAQAREESAAAVIAPVVNVSSTTPTVQGQSVRKTWRARVIDPALVPREWMVVNQQALDAFARSTKGAVRVAGVEMYEDTTLASSSR